MVAVAAALLWWWPDATPQPAGSLPTGQTPRAVDVTTIAPEQLVDAVLDECQRPLRGKMARLSATVATATLGTVQVFAELPARARVQGEHGGYLLLDDDVLPLTADAEAPPPARLQALRDLRTLVDAAALGPLHRATSCRRDADGTFVLGQPDAGEVTLRLRPGTLLPASLGRAGHDVQLLDYLRTRTTWIVSRASSAGLGECRITFDSNVHDWAPDFFVPPGGRRSGGTTTQGVPLPGERVETRSPTPILVDGKAMTWAVVPDPGDWAARVAAYRPLCDEIVRQGQQRFGFPGLWRDGEHDVLAAPFRPRDGGPAFVAPPGWRLVDVAEGHLLVVYPAAGDLAAKVAEGTRLLQEALARLGLEARGPIVAQPYLHLDEGEPPAAKLADPVVRMLVSVRNR
ncbi:MAG: hypothetical protein JNN13_16475 [Planctomycetes bacterium]|nr:hypothetical protein [Planctomycetota bacterium]